MMNSCGKTQDCMAPPPSITFKLQSNLGNDISPNFADGVTVQYSDKGEAKTVEVKTTVEQQGKNVSFFSYFPSLAGGGISDFTLKLKDGSSYPIKVELGTISDKCSSPPIKQIQFDGNVVAVDMAIQPNTYLFRIK